MTDPNHLELLYGHEGRNDAEAVRLVVTRLRGADRVALAIEVGDSAACLQLTAEQAVGLGLALLDAHRDTLQRMRDALLDAATEGMPPQ